TNPMFGSRGRQYAPSGGGSRFRRPAMTAEQWLECNEPGPMLELLRGQGDRRLRLVACACARALWERAYPQSRAAVGVAERYADGLASDEELDAAEAEASQVVDGDLTLSIPDTAVEYYATAAATEAAGRAYHWSTPDGLYTKKTTVWDCARKAAQLVTD